MTVPPLIPGASAAGLLSPHAPAPVPLPLPEPPPVRTRAGLLYAIARISPAGRVCVWPLLDRLGWPDSATLTATVVNTSVVLWPDRCGVFSLGRRRMVVLPVGLRRRCGITSGEDVLMVADPVRGVLVAHPLHTLDALVLGYHASLAGGEDGDQ